MNISTPVRGYCKVEINCAHGVRPMTVRIERKPRNFENKTGAEKEPVFDQK